MTNPTNRPTNRRTALLVISVVVLAGMLFCQPVALQTVSGQAATLSLIDVYGAQATLNALATQSAYQQQQSAAQAAALQAQAYAQAQQATASAQQQQAQIVAAQATADAAALQATAIVQQTRTAIEMAAQQTRSALEVRATQTAAVLQSQATQTALDATHAANEAKRRDEEAIATSVAMSVRATQSALDVQSRTEADRAATAQRTNVIGSLVLTIVIVISGVLSVLLIGKFFRGLWRSRALNPTPAPPSITAMSATPSTAANSVVDATTGDIGSRFAIIEHNDNPAALDELLRLIHGH